MILERIVAVLANEAVVGAIQLLTLIVLSWTLVWVRKYTKAAEQQLAQAMLPIVVLSFDGSYTEEMDGWGHGGFPSISVRNIGVGAAFNVHLFDSGSKLRFDDIRLVEPGHGASLRLNHPRANVAEKQETVPDIGKFFRSEDGKIRGIVRREWMIIYGDAAGREYVTVFGIKLDSRDKRIVTNYKSMKRVAK